MTLAELGEQFLNFIDEHTSWRDGIMTLHRRQHRKHTILVKKISHLTSKWPNSAAILPYLELRQCDPTKGQMSHRQLSQLFREEFLELLDLDESSTSSSSDNGSTSNYKDDDEESPATTFEEYRTDHHLPLQSKLPALPHSRSRDSSPQRSPSPSPVPLFNTHHPVTVPKSVLAQLQRKKIATLQPKNLRKATVIAVHFLGPSTCTEIAEFVRHHRLWGNLRCHSGLVGTVMYTDRIASAKKLFMHPTVDQRNYFPNRVGAKQSWSYALSDLGEQLYQDLSKEQLTTIPFPSS